MSISATKQEWLKSLHDNDGRKWVIVERDTNDASGEADYIEILPEKPNPYKTDQLGPAALRAKKVRELMKKKVSKEGKGYSTRLGYHTCTSQYTGENGIASLSGSSLNRKKRKLRSRRRPPAGDVIHVMSKRSKGKIRDKATAFFRSCGTDRIFVTLTFIQHVEDRTGWQILNKFLTMARREIPGFEYLVIAEHQPERKERTIHFHLLTNRRIPVRRWNNLWVLQQYNAGLVGHAKICGHKKRCECSQQGREISKQEIEDRYEKGTVQQVLNPFDVDRAYCISAISWYLTKYVTKQQTGEQFGCLTWHCSRRVSRLFTSQAVSPSTFRYMLSFRNYKLNRETGQIWEPQRIDGKFFSVVFINNKPAVLQRLRMLETVNSWIIEKRLPDKLSKRDLTYLDDEFYRRHYRQPGEDLDPVDDVPDNFLPSHQKTEIIWDELRTTSQ